MNQETVAIEILGGLGKLVSWSKSGYRERYPKNLVVFNSNVLVVHKRKFLKKETAEKIWYGDIDITLERENLKKLAQTLETTVVVLSESDARFANENSPLLKNFIYKVTPEGKEEIKESFKNMYNEETLTIK